MKILTILKSRSDTIQFNNDFLTINDKDTKLTSDSIIILNVDTEHQFMFINGNLMRFYDINNDDDISLDKIKTIVEHWNMTKEERLEAHRAIYNKYLETHSLEEWRKKGNRNERKEIS